MNTLIIQGNLTRDNELKYLSNGSPVCSNSVAVTKKWKDKNTNETKEKVMFLDIAIFRGAETFNQYTKKGSKILLRGSLELDQWQDQQGQKRQKHKMNVEEFTFLDSKQDNQQQQNYNAPRQQHSQTNTQMRNDPQYQQNLNKGQEIANNHNNYEQNIPVIDIDNDEIPFNED